MLSKHDQKLSSSYIKYETCDTIFYQGNSNTQLQVLKYIGNRMLKTTTGEWAWCEGQNLLKVFSNWVKGEENLKPLNVIYRPYIGKEIADVKLKPFQELHPNLFSEWLSHNVSFVKALFSQIHCVHDAIPTYKTGINKLIHDYLAPTMPSRRETLRYHSIDFKKSSIGQESDIVSHKEKYDCWKKDKNRTNNLILWGVSRGTAATFCAMEKEKYKEVKLIILEGAIDSIENVKANTKKNIKRFLISEKITQCSRSNYKSRISF